MIALIVNRGIPMPLFLLLFPRSPSPSFPPLPSPQKKIAKLPSFPPFFLFPFPGFLGVVSMVSGQQVFFFFFLFFFFLSA